MKKTTLNTRLFTIIGLLMIASSFYAQNLLVNSDFEVAVAPFGWERNNGDITLNEKSANSVHPDKDANDLYFNGSCRMPGPAQSRWIWQNVVVTTAGTYTFKFTTRIQNAAGLSGASPNNHATLGVATITGEIFPFEADGINVGTTALATISTLSNTNTEVSTTLTIDAAITKVQVKIGKNWNVAYIDDVTLQLKDVGTSLSDLIQNNFKISNNENLLTIKSEQKLTTINIVNTLGQSVYKSNSPENEFQLFGLQNGIYIIDAITSDNKKLQFKFIKN